ncbi:hypothetical protein ACFUMH_01155 [Cellulomonas sp. NPDC057328]|uniref:hypothetical protein n=1 Tax=Cellulomonas sp. NPDC057328 TaxID=3346101 RepID=UPI0036283DE5
MRSVLRWALAGAAVAAAWLAVFFLPAAVARGPYGGADALGVLLFSLLVLVPPSAVAGLLVGLVDLPLRRWVARGALGSRRRPVAAALTLFGALAAATMAVLPFTSTDMQDVAYNLGVCAVVAAAPAAVALRTYGRLAVPTPPAPADVPDPAR